MFSTMSGTRSIDYGQYALGLQAADHWALLDEFVLAWDQGWGYTRRLPDLVRP
jgi:hypothetical protein